MTIQEALNKRIPRVKMAAWATGVYLRLPLLENGMTGPWAELYDEHGQRALEIPVGSQRILAINLDGEFEPYTGDAHAAESDNYAKVYQET